MPAIHEGFEKSIGIEIDSCEGVKFSIQYVEICFDIGRSVLHVDNISS